jgi:phosphatidylserine/phosphatidylglycerophosphate/cardiolipin synthase-like enzyme
LLAAIKKAKKSIDIVIFRFNRRDIGKALQAAVNRGVKVHALIAHTNQGGAGRLRNLELRLLGAGATVDRTGDDLMRYHGKFMIVDRATLFVLGFNFTQLDMDKSRSFAVVTKHRKSVQAAIRLFEADCGRHPYVGDKALVVSPENARTELSAFVAKARKQLLIYDPKISDLRMIAILKERMKAGVDVRILGKVSGRGDELVHEKFAGRRLHVRAIIRDGQRAFVGSQSLRKFELDKRREVGVFVKDAKAVRSLLDTFESDWDDTKPGKRKPDRVRL